MASLNPFTWFQTEAPIIEADVLNFIQRVEAGVQTVVADAEKSLTWIATQAPAIASDLQLVEGFVVANPVLVANPTVLAAVTAANLAVQGLNAFAASYNKANASAADQVKAVVAGYQAVKQAQAASASAASVAVSNTTTASK